MEVNMKNISRLLFIGMISLLLYGCAGAGDYDISLPGEYSLIRSSAHNITINKKQGEDVWGEALIPAKITELNYNNQYILAKQLGLKRKYPDNANNTYEIPDESKVTYWILQVDNGNVYGPLTENEFTNMKNKLSIPADMVLKSVSFYNKN